MFLTFHVFLQQISRDPGHIAIENQRATPSGRSIRATQHGRSARTRTWLDGSRAKGFTPRPSIRTAHQGEREKRRHGWVSFPTAKGRSHERKKEEMILLTVLSSRLPFQPSLAASSWSVTCSARCHDKPVRWYSSPDLRETLYPRSNSTSIPRRVCRSP